MYYLSVKSDKIPHRYRQLQINDAPMMNRPIVQSAVILHQYCAPFYSALVGDAVSLFMVNWQKSKCQTG
jgi:hypothetical protein